MTKRKPVETGLMKRVTQSALGELGCTASFVQANFFPFNLTRVAGQETCFAQRRAQFFAIRTQSTSDTVTNCAGLSGSTATADCNIKVKVLFHIDNFKRLTHYHTGSLTPKVCIQRFLIDDNITAATAQEYAGR